MAIIPLENLAQLQIGLYVKSDCSWWKYALIKSQRKIVSENEIHGIRRIETQKLFYNLMWSDVDPIARPLLLEDLAPTDITNPDSDSAHQEHDRIVRHEPLPIATAPDDSRNRARRRLFHEHVNHSTRSPEPIGRSLERAKTFFAVRMQDKSSVSNCRENHCQAERTMDDIE
ncbi:MAG: DUF3391 domain-containing protein [Nitrospirae bacterium]|nr:MAG: DUF3391 domain-containing protein [Nitrospirota bacterium]